MDTVDLPILPIQTPLREALEKMRGANRAAVVARDGDIAWLFRAAWVVWGIAAGEQRLADLENRKRVHLASPREHPDIDFNNPHYTREPIENLLDNVGRRYLMAGSAFFEQTATIMTRHEDFKFDFNSGPADCYCTNEKLDEPHSYSHSGRPTDGKCRFDSTPIKCS